MVIVSDAQAAVTPAGNPVAVPIPVAPVVLCVIAVNAVLMRKRFVSVRQLRILLMEQQALQEPPLVDCHRE